MISIDAKKKELLGEFKNGGSEYSPQGRPIEVNTYDFEDRNGQSSRPLRGSTTSAANDGDVSLGMRVRHPGMSDSSSPPMAAAPMVHVCDFGSGRCNNSPTKPA